MNIKNVKLAVIALSTVILTSCGREENTPQKIVQELEKCLEGIKPEEVNDISEEKAVEISKCMLPYLQKVKENTEKMSHKESEEFSEKLRTELEKSKYKEILVNMDYDKVKELANSDTEESFSNNDDSEHNSSNSNKDWDAFLKSYEEYIDQYIKLAKKSKAGDMSAMTEYAEYMQKATDLQEKMEKAKSDLSTSQMAKYMKLQAKFMEAMSAL